MSELSSVRKIKKVDLSVRNPGVLLCKLTFAQACELRGMPGHLTSIQKLTAFFSIIVVDYCRLLFSIPITFSNLHLDCSFSVGEQFARSTVHNNSLVSANCEKNPSAQLTR